MSTATVRIGDAMATRMRQEHFAPSNSGALPLKQCTGRALTENRAHEEWMLRMEEAWQGHLETLQQYVRELVIKNQPGIAPSAVNGPKREYKDAGNF